MRVCKEHGYVPDSHVSSIVVVGWVAALVDDKVWLSWSNSTLPRPLTSSTAVLYMNAPSVLPLKWVIDPLLYFVLPLMTRINFSIGFLKLGRSALLNINQFKDSYKTVRKLLIV